MLSGFVTIEHFGAVLTVLPDSSLLVLRAVTGHPLGLQPGDIILGYQGVPWKTLVNQLIAAELPLASMCAIGAPSAYKDFILLGAGMNWHLFDTIDILKNSTGDTLHPPVSSMINLNVPPMLNNEQIEIPGIPFPDYFNGQIVSYGIVNNTNIGYIYLYEEWPTATAEIQFAQAVTALRNTEGLIIDMRWNMGGWAFFDEAFDILFNDYTLTIEDAVRSSPSSLTLVPEGNAYLFEIDGNPASLYDHPIAVLLGPTCVSMGDVTAQRFRYHPTVRFFGKSPGASLGNNLLIQTIPDWYLRYSITDMFHVNQPGIYLNRTEFPIDYPVWHNPSDAANSIDAVVEASLAWMNNLVYGHDLTIEKKYYVPGLDTLHVEALIENPNSHPISSTVYINNPDSTFIDSLRLSREVLTSETETWSGTGAAPPMEDHFILSISAYDSLENEEFMIRNVDLFTTAGPLVLDHHEISQINLISFQLRLFLKNEGLTTTVPDVRAQISTADTNVTLIVPDLQLFGNLAPGQIVPSNGIYYIYIQNDPDMIDFSVSISSEGWEFWSDSITVVLDSTILGTLSLSTIPGEYSLYQNYPNPFNPSTTIEFDLPKTSEVSLKLFNILGEEVATLVSKRLSAGSYSYEWSRTDGIASGVYLYRLEAEGFVETLKMILMK
jgi:hypothetical protein